MFYHAGDLDILEKTEVSKEGEIIAEADVKMRTIKKATRQKNKIVKQALLKLDEKVATAKSVFSNKKIDKGMKLFSEIISCIM